MTNYQEQLTQMQHDLETGLESMTEALANTGGDTTGTTICYYRLSKMSMYVKRHLKAHRV